jgi:hypothetical protein
MKVVWNEENKYLSEIYGAGPFELVKVEKNYFPMGQDGYFIHLNYGSYGEGDVFYASRFDIIAEELVEIDDML